MSKGVELEQVQAAIDHAAQAWAQRFEETMVRQNQSLNGVLLRGARAIPVLGIAGATAKPATSPGSLVGFSFSENNGVNTRVNLFDGPAADGGALLCTIQLDPQGGMVEWFGPGGIGFTRGLTVETSGDVMGVVYLRGPE